MRLSLLAVFLLLVFAGGCTAVHGADPVLVDLEWRGDQQRQTIFLLEGQDLLIDSGAEGPRWYRSTPLLLDYDNTACDNPPCVVEISYEVDPLPDVSGQRKLLIRDVRAGTHELSVRAGGRETRLQVVARRGDSYVGYLTELLGVPFVYAPAMTPEGHQTDLRLGADCVAVLIYGRRRQGYLIPYVAPPRLYTYTVRVSHGSGGGGVRITEGDLLHFGFQTALVSRDLEPIGVLSDNDMIIHSYHEAVEEVPFGTLPYRGAPYDVLRWN